MKSIKEHLASYGYNKGNSIDVTTLIEEIIPEYISQCVGIQTKTEPKDGFEKALDKFIEGIEAKEVNKYTEDEVKGMLIDCKHRFGGGDLDDYVPDETVIRWFNERYKNK